MMVKSGLEKIILKFHVPLQIPIPASLPGQFSYYGQIFFCTAQQQLLKDFSPLILAILGGVNIEI